MVSEEVSKMKQLPGDADVVCDERMDKLVDLVGNMVGAATFLSVKDGSLTMLDVVKMTLEVSAKNPKIANFVDGAPTKRDMRKYLVAMFASAKKIVEEGVS